MKPTLGSIVIYNSRAVARNGKYPAVVVTEAPKDNPYLVRLEVLGLSNSDEERFVLAIQGDLPGQWNWPVKE